MRKVQFAIGEYYHIYNRGVDKRDVFMSEKDFLRFSLAINLLNEEKDRLMTRWRDAKKINSKVQFSDVFSNFHELSSWKPFVEIIAYCFNPNHFHFILKQTAEKGIEKFMHKVGTSYTNYFNTKHERSGSLFQGSYKAVHVNNNNQLLWLSGYVNGNIEIHGIEKAKGYRWSSYDAFLGKRKSKILGNTDIILSQFKTVQSYKKFVAEVVRESKNRKEMIKEERLEYLLE